MLTYYDFFGAINTAFISISVLGVISQLRTIWFRKDDETLKKAPTELLSLNQFTVSFLAYLSFFVYGYSITPFNYYIVWPRLIASIIVLCILFEIMRDRKTRSAKVSAAVCSLCLLFATLGLVFAGTVTDSTKLISTSIILIVSALIAQGYYHQIKMIISSGRTGAVNLKMSQFILMMDVSTVAFALSMGINQGWPLLVLAVTSGITKITIMYLFRWVKISPTAKERRLLAGN